MNLEFRNAIEVDELGTIQVEAFEVNAEGEDVRSMHLIVDTETFHDQAYIAAKAWVKTEEAEIAPYIEPTVEDLRRNARASVVSILEDLMSRVTSKYLTTDQARWKEKEEEATKFLAIPTEDQTLEDSDTFAEMFQLSFPSATEAQILEMVREECTSVQINSVRFRGIDTFTNVIRTKVYPIIDASVNPEDFIMVVTGVGMEVNTFIDAHGL